jgi:diacylglycerol kinase
MKFRSACRGLKLGIRGQSSFFVYMFFAAMLLAAGLVLHCSPLEWSVLLTCVALVVTANLFQSAIEGLLAGFGDAARSRARPAQDIAAGGVLLATVAALLITSILLLSHLLMLFS